jgi:murein DD-endopeptidase MepM/ murein hydrolase activator NlpD
MATYSYSNWCGCQFNTKTRMKLPISSPIKPTITQLYGDKSNVAWYQSNGLNLAEHNGVDFVVGDPTLTYGTRLVCPFQKATLSKSWWDNPLSKKGNGIEIQSGEYQVRFWHCSEIVVKSKYVESDTLGYIGNSGLCFPAPSDKKPFDGSHLHLMAYKNGVLIDPLTIFNKDEWYLSTDTGVDKDLPPLFRVVKYIKTVLESLLSKLKK